MKSTLDRVRDIPSREDELILVRDLTSIGADDRPLRRAFGAGELARLRRGVYVDRDAFTSIDDDRGYDLRIAAALATRRSDAPLSHYSAARLWGLPIVGRWPTEVHFRVPSDSGRRSASGVIVHRAEWDPLEQDEVRGTSVTTLRRTLVDLAEIAPFRDAVAAIDSALAGSRIEKEQLLRTLTPSPRAGSARARRAIAFASGEAASPGESFSRVLMHECGFPEPQLQARFEWDGTTRFADFWWPELRLVGEFDGRAKYFDATLTGGRSTEQVFWAEKLRENEFRDAGLRLVRWTWRDLVEVTPFIRRLELAGLRRTRRPLLPA